MLRILREDRPHSSLPDMDSKLDWEGRVIGVNFKGIRNEKANAFPSLVSSGDLEKGETMGDHFCQITRGFPCDQPYFLFFRRPTALGLVILRVS